MNRNEYRRAFIMLRAALPGYGGHVRLERRTLSGSMYFIVNAPQDAGTLTVLLAGQRDGAYCAAPVGALSRDRRGQLTLAYSFDPRAIDGRPLEAYAWVVVARADGAVALTGNVEGSRPMDAAALGQAVRARIAPEPAPAFDLPGPEEAEPRPPLTEPEETEPRPPLTEPEETEPQPPLTEPDETEPRPPLPAPEPAREDPADDIRIYTGSRCRAAAPAEEIEPPQREPLAEAAVEGDAPRTAAGLLGLDITRPWPGSAEALRRLFATQAAADDAPDDGFTYVRYPMPRGSGYAESLVGLKAEDGRPTAIRYALPGQYRPEPPAGMEGYRWTDAGCWVTDTAIDG